MNVVLFINGILGLKILKQVIEKKDVSLNSVFLNTNEKRTKSYDQEVTSIIQSRGLQIPILSWCDSESVGKVLDRIDSPAIGVSALFGHILSKEVISKFSKGILNLHPSLLPIGRGAHPIPWNIVEKMPQGVTIHLINESLDSGEVIFQKQIPTDISMSAGKIYEIAMSTLEENFLASWENWESGEITPYPQPKFGVTQHRKSELASLKSLIESDHETFGDFVRRIQATTFSNGELPLFRENTGKVWKVSLTLLED